ncbi:MAG: hypothetical protein F6K17_35880 [Okeania sp. SIO3C4]|nr:hypothetical protein [Okeania sp. SIO3C4]
MNKKEEGRKKKEEGRRKKEERRRKKEEGKIWLCLSFKLLICPLIAEGRRKKEKFGVV